MKVWIGRILSALAGVFLVMDAVMKVARAAPSIEGTVALGFPESSVVGIGVLLLACVALYLVPRTAVIGAILVTGYLGGAIAAHVRMDNPLFTHTLFPLYVATMIWGGLALRDARVRTLMAPPQASPR